VDYARPVVVLDGIDVGIMIPRCGFTVAGLIVVFALHEVWDLVVGDYIELSVLFNRGTAGSYSVLLGATSSATEGTTPRFWMRLLP
jgi:hypothetical protein